MTPIPGKFYQLKDSDNNDSDSYFYLVSYEGTTGQFLDVNNDEEEHELDTMVEVPPMRDGVCTPAYPFKEGDKFEIVLNCDDFEVGTEVKLTIKGNKGDFIHRFEEEDGCDNYVNPWQLKPLVPAQTETTILFDF